MKYTYLFIFALLTFLDCQNDSISERVTFKSYEVGNGFEKFNKRRIEE